MKPSISLALLPPSLCLPAILACVAAPAAAQVFSAKQYDAGVNAYRIVPGDFNGDGILDVASNSGSDIHLLAGVGGGAFVPAGDFTPVPGAYLRFIEAAELTGDHKLDLLALADTQDHTTNLLVIGGDGLGGFSVVSSLTLAAEGFYAELDDLDGNGTVDVVLIDPGYVADTPGQLITLFNDGAGYLSFGARYAAGELTITVDLGDLNGDGALDAVVPDYMTATVNVLLGDGAGGFGAFTVYPAILLASSVALGDLNGDGALDLVVGSGASGGQHPIAVFLGDGLGGLAAPVTFPAGNKQGYLDLADVSGDGALDLLTLAYGVGGNILLGDGAGGFGAPKHLGIDDNSSFAEFADADGDGALDVLVSMQGTGPNTLTVLHGDGAGNFDAPAAFEGVATARRIVAVDVNGNGSTDLVLLSSNVIPANIAVLQGDGAGEFAPPVLSAPLGSALDLAIGDWNGDGVPDAAVTYNSPKALAISLGNATSSFPAPTVFPLSIANAPQRVLAGDVNLDGSLDVSILFLGTFATLLGDGAGHFAAPIASLVSASATDAALADVTGDGKLDMVFTGFFPGAPSTTHAGYALGNGAGGFGPVALLDTADAFASRVSISDVNADGAVDVVVVGDQTPIIVGEESDRIVVLKGNGVGGFTALPSTYAPHISIEVLLTDLNGDGHVDVATLGERLMIRRGDGTGAWGHAEFFSNGPMLSHGVAADLDGDGAVDFAGTSSFGASVFVMRNESAAPAGAAAFGTGTAGCAGTHGLTASSPPSVGNAAFALAATNAPAGALGLALIAPLADVAGSDPFGLGVTFHLDLLGGGALLGASAVADSSGTAHFAIPIPNVPSLAGATVHAQTFWLWPALAPCDPSPLGLSSSRGLTITVQP